MTNENLTNLMQNSNPEHLSSLSAAPASASPAAASAASSSATPASAAAAPTSRPMPNWVRHGIWWQIYPLGFVGAEIRPQGKREFQGRGLDALIDWLDYAVELGVSGLLLGPVFSSATHGYDTLDYLHIDPRLGGDAAFDRLAEACRKKGLNLILDGVFNHVGREHPAVAAALGHDESSPWAGLVRAHPGPDGETALDCFEGHEGLVQLDHEAQATVDYVAMVMNHWLNRGASGWRLDAAYAVPSSFWARTLPDVRRRHPDTWIFGEVIHGNYPQTIEDSTMDSLTQYELWKSIWSSLKEGNFFELDWNLKRHNEFLDEFVPQTFIGNHDVTRIASQVGADNAVLALAVLMTIGGTPSIYYGDEQAFTGIKEDRLGGDDAVRPAFPDFPDQLSPLGQDMYRVHQDLIGLRRRHPWLAQARTQTELLENHHYIYRAISPEADEGLRVDLNLSPVASVTITALGSTRESADEVLYRFSRL